MDSPPPLDYDTWRKTWVSVWAMIGLEIEFEYIANHVCANMVCYICHPEYRG
jgi:hypothetical protein